MAEEKRGREERSRESKGEMTVAEAGHRGGEKTSEDPYPSRVLSGDRA